MCRLAKEKQHIYTWNKNLKIQIRYFWGENMKSCNMVFYRKKKSSMTWFYSNNSIYTRVMETIN